jgi:hypothetical protein
MHAQVRRQCLTNSFGGDRTNRMACFYVYNYSFITWYKSKDYNGQLAAL